MKPSEQIKQVLADPTGKLKNELINELAQQAEKIWRALNEGVSEDEYERLAKMARAIETSTEIIETLTQRSSVH